MLCPTGCVRFYCVCSVPWTVEDTPQGPRSIQPNAAFKQTLNSIALNGMPLHFPSVDPIKCPVTITKWPDCNPEVQQLLARPGSGTEDVVITFDVASYEDTDGFDGDFIKLTGEASKAMQDVFLAWNVVTGGAIRLDYLVGIDADSNTIWFPVPNHPASLLSAGYAAIRDGWPVWDQISFEGMYGWLQSLPLFRDGFCDCDGARAVHALTYVLQATEPTVQLFWALVGLEALYTEGETGLLGQMREKAMIAIGESPHARKLIGEMYKIRSKLVHGKADFASAHAQWVEARYRRASNEVKSATNIAVAMLLASIRRLAARRATGFEFELRLRAPSSA